MWQVSVTYELSLRPCLDKATRLEQSIPSGVKLVYYKEDNQVTMTSLGKIFESKIKRSRPFSLQISDLVLVGKSRWRLRLDLCGNKTIKFNVGVPFVSSFSSRADLLCLTVI